MLSHIYRPPSHNKAITPVVIMSEQKDHPGFRSWCWTLSVERIIASKTVCVVFGKEVATTGTKNLQGVTVFKSGKTTSAVKKFYGISKFHLEPKKGTFTDASDYCKKSLQSHDEWKEAKEIGPLIVAKTLKCTRMANCQQTWLIRAKVKSIHTSMLGSWLNKATWRKLTQAYALIHTIRSSV